MATQRTDTALETLFNSYRANSGDKVLYDTELKQGIHDLIASKINIDKIGVANGVLGLDSDAKIPEIFKDLILVPSLDALREKPVAYADKNYRVFLTDKFVDYFYDPDDEISADDGDEVIVTLDGYRFKKGQAQGGGTDPGEGGESTLITPEKYGALGNGSTDDSAAWQACIDDIKATGGTIFCNGKGSYKIEDVDFSGIGYDRMIIIQGNGCRFIGDNCFKKLVADQSAAETAVSSTVRFYHCNFSSATYLADGTITGTAILIKCTVFSEVYGCTFWGYEQAYAFRFGLFTAGRLNRFGMCYNGSLFTYGDWTGATNANSQSNVSLSEQERFYGAPGNTEGRGIAFIGVSDSECRMATIEGHSVKYGIYFNSDASTVVMDFSIVGLHTEAVTCYDSWIFYRGAGTLKVHKIYQQNNHRTLKVKSIGYPSIDIAHWPNALIGMTIHNDSLSTRYKFEHMPSGWIIDDVFEVDEDPEAVEEPSYLPQLVCQYGEYFIAGKGFSFYTRTFFNDWVGLGYMIDPIENAPNRTLSIQWNGYLIAHKRVGLWSERPSLSIDHAGHVYLATDLNDGNGALMYWNGSEWKTSSFSGNYEDLTNKPIPEGASYRQYLRRNASNDANEWGYISREKQVSATQATEVQAGKTMIILTNADEADLDCTLPAANTWTDQEITIVNLNPTNPANVLGTDLHASAPATVPPLSAYTYFSNGSEAILVGTTGTGGGGGGGDVTLTGHQTLENKTLLAPKINLGSDAAGDLYQRKADGTLERIPLGETDEVLRVIDGKWQAGEAVLSVGAGSGGVSIGGTSKNPVINFSGSAGSNPAQAISIKQSPYNGAADYFASGTTMNGTNNSAALAAAIAAAADEQLIIVPNGNYYFPTRVILPTNKSVNIEIYGNCFAPNGLFYHEGMTMHRVVIHGEVTGRLGITTHSRTAFINGTGMNDYSAAMNWDALIESCFEFKDVYRGFYSVKYVTGYKAAIHFKGGTTANQGGQEVTIQFNYLNRNKYGIWLQSEDGSSYIDKITFSGIGGGTGRIGGHQAIFIDGHSTRTGAARSNNFMNLMSEYCNFGIKITGDATYNKFIGYRWEGGLETGHFANASTDPAIKAKAYIDIENPADVVSGGVSPKGTMFIGCSHVYVDWLTHIGNLTNIYATPIWNRNSQMQFASHARGQLNGRITVIADITLSSFSRTQLPSNVDYLAFGNATPNPATDSMLFRDSSTGTEYIQKYSGTGGTSQWTDHANGVWYNGRIGAGVAPDAGAYITAKAGTSSIASLLVQPGVQLSVAKNGAFVNDGDFLYFGLQSVMRKIMMHPPGGGAFQMLRRNAAGTDFEYVNAPIFTEYVQTTPVLIINTTETSLLTGGAKTMQSTNLSIGDRIEAKGGGGITGSNSGVLKFVCGGTTITIPLPNAAVITEKGIKWEFCYVVKSTGTNAGGFIDITILQDGELPITYNYNYESGLNSVSPSFNVLWKWDTVAGGAVFTSLDAIITTIRK